MQEPVKFNQSSTQYSFSENAAMQNTSYFSTSLEAANKTYDNLSYTLPAAQAVETEVINKAYNIIHQDKLLFCAGKRIFDIVSSAIGIAVVWPLFIAIAVKIKKEDGGPVFFEQERIGRYGEKIKVKKFRSMRVGADNLEDFLTEEQLEEYHKSFKLDNDPRITEIGNKLRKSSMDELPQLINILKGEMSVVGPRPILEEETLNYAPWEKKKLLSVRPGLTGYWQAYSRNNIDYDDGSRQKMELKYISDRSLRFDIQILIRTIRAVKTQDGAK